LSRSLHSKRMSLPAIAAYSSAQTGLCRSGVMPLLSVLHDPPVVAYHGAGAFRHLHGPPPQPGVPFHGWTWWPASLPRCGRSLPPNRLARSDQCNCPSVNISVCGISAVLAPAGCPWAFASDSSAICRAFCTSSSLAFVRMAELQRRADAVEGPDQVARHVWPRLRGLEARPGSRSARAARPGASPEPSPAPRRISPGASGI